MKKYLLLGAIMMPLLLGNSYALAMDGKCCANGKGKCVCASCSCAKGSCDCGNGKCDAKCACRQK